MTERLKMSRNFGAQTRDMGRAGAFFSKQVSDSFSTQATLAQRFDQFVEFAKENGIGRLEQITQETVLAYADSLKESELSAATQQNYLSAVNVIMEQARGDQEVRVTGREAGLEHRSGVAQEYKGNVERGELSDRTQAIVDLARNFGLRFEEASKLDARSALSEAKETGKITIENGTKGGQSREVPITNEKQLETLKNSSELQGNDRSMIQGDKTYAEHQREAYRETSNFHAERHAYANQRYSELMREKLGIEIKSPVLSDKPEGQSWSQYVASQAYDQGVSITPELAREFDREVRLELSEELGHHREDVVSAYIGGQR
ncbi:MAG: integrase [Erysipelotrichia bacterium]|nr:integrase [Erysipelotrichia bacterium]